MDAHDWTSDARTNLDFARSLCHATQDSPDKGTMALRADPRMKMIRHQCKAKTYLLGLDKMLHQIIGTMFFAG
jgi:hypothetical protein